MYRFLVLVILVLVVSLWWQRRTRQVANPPPAPALAAPVGLHPPLVPRTEPRKVRRVRLPPPKPIAEEVERSAYSEPSDSSPEIEDQLHLLSHGDFGEVSGWPGWICADAPDGSSRSIWYNDDDKYGGPPDEVNSGSCQRWAREDESR